MTINLNGSEFTLSERDKRDSDYQYYQQALRRVNLAVIQETVSDKELQLSMLLAEMRRVYTADELQQFVLGSSDFVYECLLNSLRVEHPEMTMQFLREAIDFTEAKFLLRKLQLLEQDNFKQDNAPEKKKRRS